MIISELISKLQEVKKELGDVTVLIDTEAATFTVHCVDIEDVWAIPDEISPCGPHCKIDPDPRVMRH